MEFERYKMIYLKKISQNMEVDLEGYNQELMEEIQNDNIRILGDYFVKNNKNKAKLILNNKKYKLKEFINSTEIKDDKLKINIILNKELSNASHMFENCTKLIEFSAYDNIINIDDEEYLTFEEDNLEYNEDIYEVIENDLYKNLKHDDIYQNISELTNREEKSNNNDNSTLIYFKDNIIFYQYKYYTNLSYMFYNCSLLISLPDISKWNIDNIRDISYMFYYCSSLKSLPDISEWYTYNVVEAFGIFSNCSFLLSLPDISKWNTYNVIDISFMFSNCYSLHLYLIYQNGILIMSGI